MVSRVGKMFVVKVYCKSTIKSVVAVVVKKMSFRFVRRIETSIQTSIQRPIQTVFVSTPKLKMFIQRIVTCIQTSRYINDWNSLPSEVMSSPRLH